MKNKCLVEKCENGVLARSLCSAHYQQARKAGNLDEASSNPSVLTASRLCLCCGGPLRASNYSGYCRRTKACDQARQLAWRVSRGATPATPLTRVCLNCGGPIRADNMYGYCARSLECKCLGERERLRQHPLLTVWNNIRERCYNPASKAYSRYGGRGIRLHQAWLEDFTVFETWIRENIGPRPAGTTQRGAHQFTLDRIDNDGDYTPGNLQWADHKTQVYNRGAQGRAAEVVELLRQQVRDLGGIPVA